VVGEFHGVHLPSFFVDLEASAYAFSGTIEKPRNFSWFWQILDLFVKGMDVIWHLLLSDCEIALLHQEWCMHDTQE
jgi:hypothetical protein